MSKKSMKKEIKQLNKKLHLSIKTIEALNDELDRYKNKEDQTFTNWRIDCTMTDLISGLTHERTLMKDAVRELGLRMGSVDAFLEDMRQRVPKADKVIKQTEGTILNDPKRKALNKGL